MARNEIVHCEDGITRCLSFIDGPSLTKQSFAKECDINNIVKRWMKDGLVEHVNRYQGQYGDFSDVPDYHAAQNIIAEADEMFMSLPPQIRAKFGNDAAVFLDFAQNPENKAKLEEMGLLPSSVQSGDSPVVTEEHGDKPSAQSST